MATTLTESATQTEVAVKIVDVDVHPTVMIDQFKDEIPEPWRTQYFGKSPAASISGLYGSVMSLSVSLAIRTEVSSSMISGKLKQKANLNNVGY